MACIVHGVAMSQTQLRDFHFHLHKLQKFKNNCLKIIRLPDVARSLRQAEAGVQAPQPVSDFLLSSWCQHFLGIELLYLQVSHLNSRQGEEGKER